MHPRLALFARPIRTVVVAAALGTRLNSDVAAAQTDSVQASTLMAVPPNVSPADRGILASKRANLVQARSQLEREITAFENGRCSAVIAETAEDVLCRQEKETLERRDRDLAERERLFEFAVSMATVLVDAATPEQTQIFRRAQSEKNTTGLMFVEGNGALIQVGGGWIPYDGRTIGPGTLIRTGARSSVTIVFTDGTRFRLGPYGSFQIDASHSDAAGYRLHSGSLNVIVRCLGDLRECSDRRRRGKIHVGTKAIGVRGTEFQITILDDRRARYHVFHGSIEISDRNGRVLRIVSAGETVVVHAGGEVRELVTSSVKFDALMRSGDACSNPSFRRASTSGILRRDSPENSKGYHQRAGPAGHDPRESS